jgi:carboxyl-terminal processing protease
VPSHKQSMAAPTSRPNVVSKQIYFLSITLVAIVGFIAGTRSNEILGAVAPVLGFKVETGTLDLSSVQRTYQQLKGNYDGTLDAQKLIEGASRGLTAAAGDQYTVYMSAKEASDFNNDLSGNIGGGIGAEIGVRNDKVAILRVLKDNPAEKIGLLGGDIVVAVNDENTAGWTSDQVVAKIRGKIGTTVKVGVVRGVERKDFTVTRGSITNPSVDSKIENGVGTMTISRFDDQTGNLAQKAAQSFKSANVKSIILDLRNDGGGYLTAAQSVASLWLNDKVVVSERTGGKVTDELRSDSNPILAGMPTIVLVNGGSASASEIVAGALQDNGAAKLVGEKTFGKGSVQKIIELGSGARLKVTVAKWYTPNGKNINKEGIAPNQVVTLSQDDANKGNDPQMAAALKALGQ